MLAKSIDPEKFNVLTSERTSRIISLKYEQFKVINI